MSSVRQWGVLDLPARPGYAHLPTFVVVGGYGEGIWGLRELALQLHAQSHQRVIFLSTSRWRRRRYRIWRPAVYPPTQFDQANNLLVRLSRLGVHQIIGVGHSLGSKLLLIAARLELGPFVGLRLVGPELAPGGRPGSLAVRVLRKTWANIRRVWTGPDRRRTFVNLLDGLRYIAANPYRAWREAREAPRGIPLLTMECLARQGVDIRVVQGAQDIVFPPAEHPVPQQIRGITGITMEGPHDLQLTPNTLAAALLQR